MKINFTKKQYVTLLEAVYLGIWMASSSEDGPEKTAIDELGRYLFGFAKDFGLDELVDYDEENKVHYPSAEFEEGDELNALIDSYDDNVFVNKLILSLAGRDMLEKFGEEAVKKMTDEEFLKNERSFLEKYEEEFEKNGLKNLTLLKGAPVSRKKV